ncbi:proteasome accessory factor C [Rhodococcus sp. PvR044]|uniref:helix-turn-helix transcriptional regulator n=1 Tax=unclassified Rhodococcus (in: high G+C Gram-positive bacteria) TaxID=192944 RepID=UPI000BD0A19A|nr:MULTISPECIES: YafY family protein [unclassified Rhodococcus (in: high G+C Gram-positive bacteria)]PTR45385.1 proteasome accessory factor C [Rhodococcus sp. OK611]SNX88935.1 proteasome accessory factor C [Rhodococcus sp. OK270]
MSQKLSSRLARLLNMVPYFIANPGMSAAEAAAELGVSTAQLMDDLNQLWMCGLPGYGPGDLIDLSFSEESIEVTFSAGIDRPLRLTSTEATALLVALRSLVEMPGTADPSAVQGAIAKIESAAGVAAGGSVTGVADQRERAEDPVAATVRSAVRRGMALELTYFSASRDAVSQRVVDPVRIVLVDNQSYLQAWCRQAGGVRLFRFDRIDAATELDEPAAAPEAALEDGHSMDLFHDDPTLPQARLLIAPEHAWVMDYYPMTDVIVAPDGSIEASMRYGSQDWMTRLMVGFGPGVRVLGPDDLAASVRNRAEAALAAYGEASTAD